MAVFPWGHSRSRTTSSEKNQDAALGWFGRATTEPSRQALADLMKQHTRAVSAGSGSYQGRPRTNTSSSQHSQHSRYCSTTSQGSAHASCRTHSPTVSVTSSANRPESSGRSALPISGDSRRQSSKASVEVNSISNMVVLSPPRFTPSRMGFRKRDQVVSPTRSDGSRISISRPYDFQHVAHTEQVEFNGLGRIDETELATKFNAIQDRQRSESVLRGIKTSELGVATPPVPLKSADRPQSPSPIKTLILPMTPPRPAPPPKNSPPAAAASSVDIRMSRSVENFSRPTSRCAINISNTSPIRSFASQPKLAPAAPIIELGPSIRDSVVVTSLSQAPAIGHAVSTQDDTARRMISAPLPSPPSMNNISTDHRPNHRRQSSSKGSLRHMSTFPSSRNPRPDIIFQDTQLLGIQEENETLSRHRSENVLTRYLTRNDTQTSDNVVPVDDWEGAIDYAWEHEDDVFEDFSADTLIRSDLPQESLIVVQQPSYEQVSTPSTPLMMTGPEPTIQSAVDPVLSSTSTMNDQDQGKPKQASSMIGLGIESQSRPPILELTVPNQPHLHLDISARLPDTMYSAISKSSSQESIILSIASSILSTHRSSNSSVSPADYTHLMKSEDSSPAITFNPSSQLEVGFPKAARPESTCVPAALLQGFLDTQTIQEELTDSQTYQTKQGPSCSNDEEKDEVSSLPIQGRREKSISDFPIAIPQRRSSISARDGQQYSRQRASAIGSHRRPAAPSYSLFPTASSAVPIS